MKNTATKREADLQKKSHKRTPAEQRAWQKKEDEEYAAMKRWQCNLFRFWKVCQERSCHRAHGCMGDARACFERWWPHVPEEFKVLYQALVKAKSAGLSPQEIERAANEEVARYWEFKKKYGQSGAEKNTPAPAAIPAGAARTGGASQPERIVARVRLL